MESQAKKQKKAQDTLIRLAGVEMGGTSVKIAISEGKPENIIATTRIPTTTPFETLSAIVDWLESQQPFEAIGVASFGPVDLHETSSTYGYITTTPKPGWQQTDVLSPLHKFGVPVAFNTDVNAAALGELHTGKHGTISNIAYITVGTGVGVGVVTQRVAVQGLLHPEGGHCFAPLSPNETLDAGVCPFHHNCIEGLVCTKAISKRCALPAADLHQVADDHPVIVLGGGVIVNRPVIMTHVRRIFKELVNGYLQSPRLDKVEEFIVLSKHGDFAGLVGALQLATLQ